MALKRLNEQWTSAGYIVFRNDGVLDGGVTNLYTVIATDPDVVLGVIKWFSRWRKYCFFPCLDTCYEETCLRDIADFCVQETKAHREKRRAQRLKENLAI